jgi:riboflavin biosynthesis pyrimidine reductase
MLRRLIAESDAVVMGSATYEAAREFMRPSTAKPRIILTSQPERYAEDAKQPGLEFSSSEPKELLTHMQERGVRTILLAGGAATNARFLDAGLVDEVFLTIEPMIFGDGLPLTAPLQRIATMALLSSERLNPQGTLLLHYSVNKE